MMWQRITAIKHHPLAASALAIPAAIILCGGMVASLAAAAAEERPSPPQTAQYLPSISDLMIATIQPRHRRLWQAAQNRDWAFAAYELGNLQGAFRRLGQAHPTEDDIPLPEMIASVTEQPFGELKAAIASKDETAFAKGYADLTDACNSCHQAFNHGVIAIRVPDGKSTSDQDFTAATP
jgi:hypothetical protein